MNYVCDFETNNNENDCRVWLTGIYCIDLDHFMWVKDLSEFMSWLFVNANKGDNFYFHNLGFDGDFIINWLLKHEFKHEEIPKYLDDHKFTTLISNKNIFYTITICINRGKEKLKINIKNSLCLLPFSVKELSKSFDLEETKGEIEYNKYRPVGYDPTPEEIDYCRRDCIIVGESLKKAWELSLNKLTIGSNAISKYRQIIGGKKKFRYKFPEPEYDSDIRPSYKGGWTYADKRFTNKEVGSGIVLDVNSLYPYVLYSKLMPYGEPIFKEGEPVQHAEFPLFVCSMWCSFELKPDHVPTIQLKGSSYFRPTEYVTTTKGDIVNLCLTNIDLKLLQEHYYVDNITWCGTYYFKGQHGMFTDYIDMYMDIKIKAEKENNKALRTLAKLMLNNLYGKFSTNPVTQQKIPFIDPETGKTSYYDSNFEYIDPVYIPVGIFTTAYAREHTIRAAQANYHRFMYADTDSLHLLGLEMPENIEIDPYKLGAWKHEFTFKKAKYIRAKTYIELSFNDELKVTCCGMPASCHPFVTFDNFEVGAVYPGKLTHKRVNGGVVLKETTFTVRG